MLAEADIPEQHEKAFDMSYDWKFHHMMNEIAKGKKTARAVQQHFQWVDSTYPGDSYLMQFTSNHDENSWNGTEFERMGEGAKTFAVLAATIRDMLLIYNGQESAFNRRLLFFEKDSIDWGNYSYAPFYTELIALKKRNKALWNGIDGGRMEFLSTGKDSVALAFFREQEPDKVMVLLNLSKRATEIQLMDKRVKGTYRMLYTNEIVEISGKDKISLEPWEYRVLESTQE
jgi:glycosidase